MIREWLPLVLSPPVLIGWIRLIARSFPPPDPKAASRDSGPK
jgi:hypothetical protein